MRRSNKCLSLLLVTFIVGVNALTACGQIPHTKAETAESADHSDLSFPFSDHVHVIRAARTSQLKTAVKVEQSQTGKVPGTVKISSQNTALNLRQKPAEPNAVPLESQTGTQISGDRNTTEHASIVQNPPCTASNEEPPQTHECTAIEYIPMTCTESHVPEQQDTINSVPDTPETEMPEQPDDDKHSRTRLTQYLIRLKLKCLSSRMMISRITPVIRNAVTQTSPRRRSMLIITFSLLYRQPVSAADIRCIHVPAGTAS